MIKEFVFNSKNKLNNPNVMTPHRLNIHKFRLSQSKKHASNSHRSVGKSKQLFKKVTDVYSYILLIEDNCGTSCTKYLSFDTSLTHYLKMAYF